MALATSCVNLMSFSISIGSFFSSIPSLYTPPTARTGRLAGAQFPSAAVYALPIPGRSAHRIVPHQLEPTLEGNPWNCPHRPGAGRSPFAIAAAGGAGERAHPEEEPMHGKAATRRQRVRRTLARVFAGWRTGLSGPVLVLQGGNALNYFGTGLILP